MQNLDFEEKILKQIEKGFQIYEENSNNKILIIEKETYEKLRELAVEVKCSMDNLLKKLIEKKN